MSWVIALTKFRMMFYRPMLAIMIAFLVAILVVFYFLAGTTIWPVYIVFGLFILLLVGLFLIQPRYQRWYVGILHRHKGFRWYIGAIIIIGIIAHILDLY